MGEISAQNISSNLNGNDGSSSKAGKSHRSFTRNWQISCSWKDWPHVNQVLFLNSSEICVASLLVWGVWPLLCMKS